MRLNSTKRGTSFDRQILTLLESEAALQKFTRYLSENVRETGSVSSISTLSSGLSTLVCCLTVTAPLPISPWQRELDAVLVRVDCDCKSSVNSSERH